MGNENGFQRAGPQFFIERDIYRQSSRSLWRGILSCQEQIRKHQEYLENPASHVPDWDSLDPRYRAGLLRHWSRETENFRTAIERRIQELKRRGDYHE